MSSVVRAVALLTSVTLGACDPVGTSSPLPEGCPVNSTGGPRGICDAPPPHCDEGEIPWTQAHGLIEGCADVETGLIYGRVLDTDVDCEPGDTGCPRSGFYMTHTHRVDCDADGLVITWGPIDPRGNYTCVYITPSEPLGQSYPLCGDVPSCGYPSALIDPDGGLREQPDFRLQRHDDVLDAGLPPVINGADADADAGSGAGAYGDDDAPQRGRLSADSRNGSLDTR